MSTTTTLNRNNIVTSAQDENDFQQIRRDRANMTTVITGDLYIERDGNDVLYGLKDACYWDIHLQQYVALSTDPDKFMIRGANFHEAKAEFWGRMQIFTQRRFGGYVKTEIRKIFSDRN